MLIGVGTRKHGRQAGLRIGRADAQAAWPIRLGYLATVPPASVHSFADFLLTQPWPLQVFWPLQALLAVLHSDVPLQLLTPAQCTEPLSAACTVVLTVPMANRAAAALAIARPDLKFVMWISFGWMVAERQAGGRRRTPCTGPLRSHLAAFTYTGIESGTQGFCTQRKRLRMRCDQAVL
eukprot:Opistho-1_new@105621